MLPYLTQPRDLAHFHYCPDCVNYQVVLQYLAGPHCQAVCCAFRSYIRRMFLFARLAKARCLTEEWMSPRTGAAAVRRLAIRSPGEAVKNVELAA